jgi:hypothetical protein
LEIPCCILCFDPYKKTKYHLKQQILDTIPETCIKNISDIKLGYAQNTVLNLLNHLDTANGLVKGGNDIDKNVNNMNKPWSSNPPIEDIFHQLRLVVTLVSVTESVVNGRYKTSPALASIVVGLQQVSER